MWFVCLGVFALIAIAIAWRSGPSLAVGVTLLVSLLLPKWMILDVGGMPLDLRVATGIVALSVYCLHPRAVFRTRLIALDYIMIAMLVVHAISDTWHEGFGWGIFVRIYGEWMVPYLAGRVAILNWEHVRSLTPFAVGVVLVLVVLAACESFWNWNAYEYVFGKAETDGPPRNLSRLGLIRAFGPTKNPIYFGTLLLLLFPWCVFAAVLAYRKAAPKVWLGMPLLTIAGIVFTGSRAPILALLPFAYTMALVWMTRWRRTLVTVGILLAGLMMLNASNLVHMLHLWGERTHARPRKVVISDAEVEYTSTLHRLYLWDVYATAMRRAGWFGFGTESTSTFPPNVPTGPEHAETLKLVWCVDSAFVLMTLRFGYLGVACLIFAGLAAAWTYWRLAQNGSLRWQSFAGSMCGAIVGTFCVLFTVWMPHDFGFWLLWTFGAGAALYSHTSYDIRTRNVSSDPVSVERRFFG
jgi:hypothetical protein